MADVSKANKIAAARKKLKEFQQKSDGRTKKDHVIPAGVVKDTLNEKSQHENVETMTLADTYLSPPVSNNLPQYEQPLPVEAQNIDTNETYPSHETVCESRDTQSDTLTIDLESQFLMYDKINFNTNSQNDDDAPNLRSYFTNSSDPFNFISTTELSESLDVNKTNVNEVITEEVKNEELINLNDEVIFKKNDDANVLTVPHLLSDNVELTNDHEVKRDAENECPVEIGHDTTQHLEDKIEIPSVIPEFPKVQISSTENIRQLSSHLQYFIDEDVKYTPSSSYELEKRNQELAAMLENKNVETQQLTLRLQEYLNRIHDLEQQVRVAHSEQDARLKVELGPLKEQLEYHAQTIGLLVGEKSELTAALEQTQTSVKQKVSECEELQSRLKASRHRAGDLERELTQLKSSYKDHITSDQSNNLAKLKDELQNSKDQVVEFQQEISESIQKYNAKSNECVALQKELAEKTSQLSLTQLKLQQVCNSESSELEIQMEELNNHKIALEMKINELNAEIKALSYEKDKSNEQYQQYVYQLNGQLQTGTLQLEQLTKDHDRLSKRESELLTHISNLEKDIQQLQSVKKVNTVHKEQLEVDTLQLTELQMKLGDKTSEVYKLLEEKQDLLKELEERSQRLTELEESIVEMKNDQPDAAKLAAAMESDKVAAAQAIKQNVKLTQQIEELQDKFVEITQAELKLTEKLESEQHLGQEILKQLKTSEHEIDHLKQTLFEKDRIISDLEIKLGVACPALNTENTEHKNTLPKFETPDISDQIIDQQETNLGDIRNDNIQYDEGIEKYLAKSDAMKKLEERFTNTMSEIARLTEEKQQLEHLVLQLQSETETIGEYIALYQFQRGILKQRSHEKDEELRLLNTDREEMKQKLAQLNNLIQHFVSEKVPENIVEQYNKLNEPVENDLNEINTPQTIQHSKLKTADKIIELLTEINSSNLIEPKEGAAHCPLCSGQLITV